MKKGQQSIVVLPCPEESRTDEAKLQLMAAAAVLHQRAADALAQGLFHENQAARLETLVDGCADEDLERIRDLFVEEGLLEIEANAFEVTSRGGNA